jgi:hypothetical protein
MIISFNNKGKIGVLLLLAVCSRSFGQTDSISLKISWLEKRPVVTAQKDSDLVLNITLSSQLIRPIKVQNRQVFYVREMNFPGADACVEVKTTGAAGTDSTVAITNSSDQLLLTKPPPPVTLSKNQSITYSFDLINYYLLEPRHTYRIRICYELSSFNDDLPDVYSNWLTFDL